MTDSGNPSTGHSPDPARWALREREKELQAIYGIVDTLLDDSVPVSLALPQVADLLASAMRFSDNAHVRIRYFDKVVESKNFASGSRVLAREISHAGRDVGRIEVFYTGLDHPQDEDPFLAEERAMLRNIAGILGSFFRNREDEPELVRITERIGLFEAIVNESPAIAFVWNMVEGWPVAFVSENIRQFGYAPQEFYEGTVEFADLVHEDDLERVAGEVATYMASGVSEFYQSYRIVTRSRKVRWVADWTRVLRDASGNAEQNQGILLDITNQIEAERQAAAMASFVREDPNPVLRIDLEGNVLVANTASGALVDSLLDGSQDQRDSWLALIDEALATTERRVLELVAGDRIYLFDCLPVVEEGYINLYGSDISEERENQSRLTDVANNLPGAIFQYVLHPDGTDSILFTGPGFEELWGLDHLPTPCDARVLWDRIVEEDRETVVASVEGSGRELSRWDTEFRIVTPGGVPRWLRGAGTPRRLPNGDLIWNSLLIDVTDWRLAEEGLRRAQKMDAIGQMAGGIAHDFNNALTVILGNLERLRKQVNADAQSLHRIDVIEQAAVRAADLTRRLLTFARKDAGRLSTPVDVNSVVVDMGNLIARTLTPEIAIEQHLTDEPWLTRLDRGELEDAILNLVLNARDAMPDGGTLTLETTNRTLDAGYCARNPGAHPGDYVCLAVSDTGAGIPVELQARVFEPFFSTKMPGKGTGLGLPMVYGFVQGSGGHLKLYSEPGMGTTVRLYLPRCESQQTSATTADEVGAGESPLPGHETILVVDDETDLLELVCEMLEGLGYHVLTAGDGIEALQQLGDHPEVDLLFSDVIMPGGLNGFELADRALERNPDLRVLFASGYAGDALAKKRGGTSIGEVLSKPYTDVELSKRIRELLDDRSSPEDVEPPGVGESGVEEEDRS